MGSISKIGDIFPHSIILLVRPSVILDLWSLHLHMSNIIVFTLFSPVRIMRTHYVQSANFYSHVCGLYTHMRLFLTHLYDRLKFLISVLYIIKHHIMSHYAQKTKILLRSLGDERHCIYNLFRVSETQMMTGTF